ncbi:MAG: hypothetical protein K6E40_05480, partial [Desulfovibrio sp.]|nr:hypothetical protein [Desulfovibrio sp.]
GPAPPSPPAVAGMKGIKALLFPHFIAFDLSSPSFHPRRLRRRPSAKRLRPCRAGTGAPLPMDRSAAFEGET